MIPAFASPHLLALLAIACLAAGAAILLRHPGYRIARLLRGAPGTSIGEALAGADGAPRYVRLHGRITSEEEFPDEHERPLVYRRRRLEVLETGGRWRTVEDDREAVAFGIEERSAYVAIDAAALDEGLVVLARIAEGRAADLPGRLPEGIAPEAPARLRVEQVSAVELATVAGVPRRGPDGDVVVGAGLGRPLILTTLELPASMRLLGGGHRMALLLASVLLAMGLSVLALALLVATVGAARG